MRYQVRWSNGYWKLFDAKTYASVDTFGLEAQAVEAAASANTQGTWRICNAADRLQ
jgi:hypothetical protein